jgi:hypothetical protein
MATLNPVHGAQNPNQPHLYGPHQGHVQVDQQHIVRNTTTTTSTPQTSGAAGSSKNPAHAALKTPTTLTSMPPHQGQLQVDQQHMKHIATTPRLYHKHPKPQASGAAKPSADGLFEPCT